MIEAAELRARITNQPDQCDGYPCIRGMPIRVSDIMDRLGDRLTPSKILEEMPDLEAGDILAAIHYATGDYVEMRKLWFRDLTLEELFADTRRLEAVRAAVPGGAGASAGETVDTPAQGQ
jgi:uncharacterized protein (DUF433 family)